MPDKLIINGHLVFEINSKQHWVNKFPGSLPKLPPQEKYLWIDAAGNIATQGEDFMIAESENKYPIKIYLVQRTSHLSNPEYVSKLHHYLGIKKEIDNG